MKCPLIYVFNVSRCCWRFLNINDYKLQLIQVLTTIRLKKGAKVDSIRLGKTNVNRQGKWHTFRVRINEQVRDLSKVSCLSV